MVCPAGRCPAVSVEPAFDIPPTDAVQSERTESGQKLFLQHVVDRLAPPRPPPTLGSRLPLTHCKIPKRRNDRLLLPVFPAGNFGAVLNSQAFPTSVLDGLERCRTDRFPHRCAVYMSVPDEAAMARRAHPYAQPGNAVVPHHVFRLARLQLPDAGVREAYPRPARHARSPERTGARASTASRTDASDRCAYFRVVVACS